MRNTSIFPRSASERIGFVLFAILVGSLIWLTHSSASKVNSTLEKKTANGNKPAASAQTPATDQFMYAPIYTTKGGRSSSLGMNNSTNHPITAHVTLFNKHGLSLTVPDVTLDAHKNHAFDLADWVHDAGGGFEEGSIMVVYQGHSMELGAQETITEITDSNHSLTFDVHLQEPMDFMSAKADGVWWTVDNQTDAEICLANTAPTQVVATPTFFVGGIGYQGEAITLNGHESDSINIKQSLNRLHVNGNTAVGGVSLAYSAPGNVAAVGLISKKQTGFSTTMRFIDRTSQKTTILHGASLLIGKPSPDAGFSATTQFTPHVVVRNNTAQSNQITARVRYTISGQPNQINLSPLTLTPNEVRELNLTAAVNAVGSNIVDDSGIEIEHSGSPGAVMAYAASIDQTGSAVFDVPIKDPKAESFKGGSYPWNISGGNRSVLHVKNVDAPGDGQKREFMAKLYFDGGEYNIALQRMDAGQTVDVDIKKLRDDQVKDVLGNVIPLNVTGGQLAWYGRATKGQFIGRLIIYNPVTGISNSFSCVQNCLCNPGFLSGRMRPEIISGFANDSFPLDAIEVDADCNQANLFDFEIFNPIYESSNTNVVTISGSFGDQTATLVGAGDAEITVSWDASSVTQNCTAFASDGECVDATCPSTNVGSPIDSATAASCSRATGETTTTDSWTNSYHQFRATALPTTISFAGRSVTERDSGGGGPDTCWFQGSQVAKWETIDINTGTVDSQNQYGDQVGWDPNNVLYYRAQGRAPCGTTLQQSMSLYCGISLQFFKYNTLQASFTATQVTNVRDGISVTRTWP